MEEIGVRERIEERKRERREREKIKERGEREKIKERGERARRRRTVKGEESGEVGEREDQDGRGP